MIAPDRTRSRGPRVLDGLAVLLLAGAGIYVSFGSPLVTDVHPVELGSALTIGQTPGGRPVAEVDEAAWRAGWEQAGLPAPPSLGGSDPVPLELLIDAAERWSRTRDPEALGEIAQIYVALEEHRAALERFAALVTLAPDDPRWRYLLGAEAQTLGLDDLAIATLDESARREPDYATTFGRLGQLHLDRGDLDRAAANYERYRGLRPGESLGSVGLGRVALARGETAEAETVLRRATELSPIDYLARRLLARALAANGALAASRREASVAENLPRYSGWLSFDPRLQDARRLANTQGYLEGQGELASRRGDFPRLIEILNELIERRPDDVRSLTNLAMAYRQNGQLARADATVDRGLELAPDSPELYCVRAEVDFSLEAFTSTRNSLEKALALNPEYARAHDLLGRTLFLQGHRAEAIASMQRAVALDPAASKVRLALAVMLERMDRLEEAEQVLTDLLENDPANEAARRLLETVRDRLD